MKIKQRSGFRFTKRDVVGTLILIFLLLAIGWLMAEKNFSDALGPQKTFEKSDRIVLVKIVADPSYLNPLADSWEENSEKILYGTSENFEKNFGIKLIPCEKEIWKDYSQYAMIKNFRKDIKNGRCDTAVLFTNRIIEAEPSVIGIVFHRHIIVKNEIDITQTLIHEFGHIFGAVHRDHKAGLIMNTYDDYKNKEQIWDELNWRIIIFNKYTNFHKYDFVKPYFNF